MNVDESIYAEEGLMLLDDMSGSLGGGTKLVLSSPMISSLGAFFTRLKSLQHVPANPHEVIKLPCAYSALTLPQPFEGHPTKLGLVSIISSYAPRSP